MYIQTKRTKVIVMTHEEHEKFLRLMEEAKRGQVVNYAEASLDDGSFLGVSLVNSHEMREKEQAEKYRRHQERQERRHG